MAPATLGTHAAVADADADGRLGGIVLMLVAAAIFTVGDGVQKHLTAEVPVVQIVWAKLLVQVLVAAAVCLRRQRPAALLRSRRPGLQIARSLVLLASSLMFVTALAFIPLADAVAILFVAPLFVTALSAVVLREPVGLRRWSAVAAGFIGAVIIARPGLGALHWAAALALGAAATSALFQVATRSLAAADPPITTLLHTSLGGFIVVSLLVPGFWTPLTPSHWALLLVTGLTGVTAHFLLIKAFARAPASVLAPFGYTEVLYAMLAGYLAFGEVPDRWTALGATVVVASGLYVIYRESLQSRAGAPGR